MQVAPPKGGQPAGASTGWLSAPRLVTTTNAASPSAQSRRSRRRRRGGRWESERWATREKKVPRFLSSPSPSLKLCYSGRSRWPLRERDKAAGRTDFSSVLESEGSAQLWTACLLSVCLSPSKSTPSHIFFPPLPHLSLLSDHILGLAHVVDDNKKLNSSVFLRYRPENYVK